MLPLLAAYKYPLPTLKPNDPDLVPFSSVITWTSELISLIKLLEIFTVATPRLLLFCVLD